MDTPESLGAAGAEIWQSIAGNYTLRPDEKNTLLDVCEMSDMVAALKAAWAEDGKPLTATGSMGQLVTHPLISEIRTHRMARNALWRQLKLPDESGVKPNQQRDAANSRWASAHGNTA
jgi:hypothetical protein